MLQMAGRMDVLGTETAFEVLARANALAAQGRSIINLGIGQPDFPTPDHIVEAGIKANKTADQLKKAKALAKYEPEEYRPGSSIQDDLSLAKAAGELGTTIFHPVGTCKMGSDPLAVVDDELRVHGIGRLRVIDASIFPRITSGNTNAPTYVIAEKGARAILKPNPAAPI